MKKEIKIHRIAIGTVYRIVFIGCAMTITPFSIIMGIFALFGANTVEFDNKSLTGFTGFIASPFIGLGLSLGITLVMGSILALGLWIYSRISPMTIVVYDVNN